ncbi:hypothetical protein BKE38_02770 [Pseudoroseomonas deserti]|uniref:Phage tail protein n=1 Tax=Teichococcus deserti TaxID=1817963 RepID=A0A1V2H7I3_9PROT|nr:hypothetical protein [Pseudoroseomonas deserti]ONG58582.1 hypothetical protein BKE38_02770 [Pseudoroseomonas deserti]
MDLELPSLAGGTQPAILRPRVALDFAPAAGEGGGMLGALSDAASALGLGGDAAALADRLISLRLVRSLAPEVDSAEFLLLPEGAPPFAAGDPGSITLAAADASARFPCRVEAVEQRGHGLLRALAGNGGRILAQSRLSRSYANQDAGAIIGDLAQQAGVDSAVGSLGRSLPRYVADDRRSLYEHVAALAASAGRLAGFDEDGRLALLDDTATGEALATFTLGVDILDMRLVDRLPHAGALLVDGAGAADAGGGEAWSWLRKQVGPLRAASGEGTPQRRLAAPWLTAPQAVAGLLGARSRAEARQRRFGRLLVQGAPQLRPGALVALKGTPADGNWLITRLEQRFDARHGLTARLDIAEAGGGGGGLASALGGLL